MPRGFIKTTRLDKGYAFLTSNEGEDVFVHVMAAERTGAKLDLGLWYEYDLQTNKRRPGKFEACNLRPLSREEAEKEEAWAGRNPPPVKFGEMPGNGQ